MSYEPLHHKYRPQTFPDLVGQEAIAKTLINAIELEKIAPAYLFTGPRGTGKTSSARILAKSLNCLTFDKPTPNPCGKCEVCTAITTGNALDVIEIDAASNTGVDNIREIIERSRFAPVQSRYKVYAIDECLTGDSLIQTSEGLTRIDNPNIKGKLVLSFNETTKVWEYKKVLRWLERGTKKTLVIKTANNEIRCTENHLIRTDRGWIEAKNVKEGMKILSPVNVDAGKVFTNTVRMEECADLYRDTNLKAINTEANLITSTKFSNKQQAYNLCVNVDVKKNSIFPPFCKKKVKESKVFNRIGVDTLTKKVTEFGIDGHKTLLNLLNNCKIANWDSYTAHCWEMEALIIPTYTVDFPDYAGHMGQNNKNGWNIRQVAYSNYVRNYKQLSIKDTANNLLCVKQLVILYYEKFIEWLSPIISKNQFLRNGFNWLHQKDWRGGIWMMDLYNSAIAEVQPFFSILRDFLDRKIKLLPNGSLVWDIQLNQNFTPDNLPKKPTITSSWEQNPVVNGYQIYSNTPSPQWITNLEKVESVSRDGNEPVYDLEVEDNHNFVANGLLVHNCHMLSTAAFNALLKTLEEPPPQVVFILATTDPQRVLSTIISRCQRFDYRRIPLEAMVSHLKYIAEREKIDITPEALTLNAQIANGGLRDAESLLDQLSLFPETITVDKIWDLVGAVPERDLLALLVAIRKQSIEDILAQSRSLLDRGREPLVLLQNLAGFYLNLLIAKTSPQRQDLVGVTETCWQQLCEEAQHWQLPMILQGQQRLKEGEVQIKNTTQPRLWLEVILLSLLEINNASGKIAPQSQVITQPTTQPTFVPSVSQNVTSEKIEEEPIKENKPSVLETKTDRTNNNISATPIEPETKNDPNRAETIGDRQALPNITQNTANKQNEPAISQNYKSQPAREPQPLENNSQVESQPTVRESSQPQETTPINSNTEEQIAIWQRVIDTIHPPMTQALLRQQCHLISLSDSAAIVGISSAPLHKMNLGKVPNIEAAFAKVCGRTIKVTLEVAGLPDKGKKNFNLNHNNNQPQRSYDPQTVSRSTNDIQKQKTENNQEKKRSHNDSDRNSIGDRVITNSTVVSPKIENDHNNFSANNLVTKSYPSQPQFKPEENGTKSTASEAIKTEKSDRNSHLNSQAQITVTEKHNQTQIENNSVTDRSLVTQNSDLNPDTFDKAVELIAQKFDGEVIDMSDRAFTTFSADETRENKVVEAVAESVKLVQSESTEIEETIVDKSIKPETPIKISSKRQKVVIKRESVVNYDYDDDDVPF